MLFFSGHLIFIQIFKYNHLAKLASKQHNHFIELEPVRGTIYDRRMRPLALNVTAYSLYANPQVMSLDDKRKAVENVSSILKLDPQVLTSRLANKKYFVWIQRKLSLETARKIKDLKIKGLDFVNESKRYYPNAELASHVIGFAGIDNEGLEGIELKYNDYLKGESGWTQILRDAHQRDLMISNRYIASKDGYHIVLTIDETIQFIAERALDKAYRKHNAKAATIIVMDTKTGEILALANRPTYNLEEARTSDIEHRTDRAISFVYEPGSVFKIVTATAALEEQKFVETDMIFCENGAFRVANHILHDHGKHGMLTFKGVFEQSSNIGVTKIAQKLGPALIYEYAQRFRFGMKTNIELEGEVNGLLKPPSAWSKTSIGAIPMGQEVTVTPIQLVGAISAIANGGTYMRPYILKYVQDDKNEIIKFFEPEKLEQVMSPQTALRVTEILNGVVEKGTGQMAQIKGIKVAGKTGTAQKVINGKYSHDLFNATFFGFAPSDNPRVAVIVVLDEPHHGHFGGVVSAPVFKEVVENTLKYLGNSQNEMKYADASKKFVR